MRAERGAAAPPAAASAPIPASSLDLLGPLWPRRAPDQVALLVGDIGSAIRSWSAILGADPERWLLYTYNRETVPDLEFRGARADFSMALALHGSGPQIELIEHQRGRSLYAEWVETHGYGVHHFGWFVPNLDEIGEDLRERGILPVQTGSGYGLHGDGGFAYFEVPGLGLALELIQVPRVRRPSEPIPNPIEN